MVISGGGVGHQNVFVAISGGGFVHFGGFVEICGGGFAHVDGVVALSGFSVRIVYCVWISSYASSYDCTGGCFCMGSCYGRWIACLQRHVYDD